MNPKLQESIDFLRRIDLPCFEGIVLDSPNVRSPLSGETMLHIAVIWDDLDFVQALLEAGADPNVQDKDGYTPLHLTVSGKLETVSCLLSHGANPNLVDHSGHTPTDFARLSERADILALFNPASDPEGSPDKP